jgi:hypothetical protein
MSARIINAGGACALLGIVMLQFGDERVVSG